MSRTLAEVAQLLAHSPSITIATRDEAFAPEIVRGCAAAVRADGTIVVAVAMPEGERALANLDANGAIALTMSRPTTYETLQVKGRDAHREAWPDAALAVDQQRVGFMREVGEVGMPPALGGVMWSRAWIAIAFTPTEIREQTPGAT